MTHTTTVEALEQIHQLALVGQAALKTNLTLPHMDNAVASLLEVIAEISEREADKIP